MAKFEGASTPAFGDFTTKNRPELFNNTSVKGALGFITKMNKSTFEDSEIKFKKDIKSGEYGYKTDGTFEGKF